MRHAPRGRTASSPPAASDYPNQVNNVLGFPFIFRGALDVRASTINDAMKIAAAEALAMLAREDVPEEVAGAGAGMSLRFGPEYIIPNAFDPRLISRVSPAVAKAAMDIGRCPQADHRPAALCARPREPAGCDGRRAGGDLGIASARTPSASSSPRARRRR